MNPETDRSDNVPGSAPEEQPQEEHRFRNHPTILISNAFVLLVVFGFLWFFISDDLDGTDTGLVITGMAVLFALAFIWMIFWWMRTYYIFTSTELRVSRVAITKSNNRIQYTRLASITVKRDLFNRVFGTSTLMFNVNSSVNATSSEATLVLKKDVADRLRNRLSSMIFNNEGSVEEDRLIKTLANVTNRDVIMHAIFGQPTYQAIFGFLMLVYAVVMLFYDNSGGFFTAALLFAVSEIIPFISVILKYYNYRIYRVNDTVVVECGLITTTRHSFKINKINSVRVREPLLARLVGRATLEGEVVGMADGDENNIPLLCPLKKKADVMSLMGDLVPEFVIEDSGCRQPRRALAPMLITDTVFAVIVIAVCAALLLLAESYLAGLSDSWRALVKVTEVIAAIAIPLLVYGHSGLAQKHRTFEMGSNVFMFVCGGYDTYAEFINYDKVQFVEVSAGPFQRMFNVAKCTVNMMSSVGFKQVTSGLFDPDDLERLPAEVMARIKDGRYDYRRYL